MRKVRDRDVRVKAELILLAHKIGNVSEACARRGFSRQFYYKWWGRLKRARYDIWALSEKSRRPRKSPKKISASLEARIRRIRDKGYGAPMIQALLKRDGVEVAVSTISHVLNRRRRPSKRRKNRLKSHNRRYELNIPGERIQIDVKYVPEQVEGCQVYTYVAIDECTRMRFAYSYGALNERSTIHFLEKMKAYFPFTIRCIQTDNGQEFTYRLNPMVERTHDMTLWCETNGIRHRMIPPGEKELNGKVERSHRIDEQYFYWRAPTDSLKRFNRELGAWIEHYNTHRPHGGLGFMTPMQKLHEKMPELSGPKPVEPTKTQAQRLMERVEREIKKLNDAA